MSLAAADPHPRLRLLGAVSLYAEGQPLIRIALQPECHPDAVRRALIKTGAQMRHRYNRVHPGDDQSAQVPSGQPRSR